MTTETLRQGLAATIAARDVRHLTRGDAAGIERIAGREHVATPCRVVARKVQRKIKGFRKLDRGLQAAILRHARKSHFANRDTFKAWRF